MNMAEWADSDAQSQKALYLQGGIPLQTHEDALGPNCEGHTVRRVIMPAWSFLVLAARHSSCQQDLPRNARTSIVP